MTIVEKTPKHKLDIGLLRQELELVLTNMHISKPGKQDSNTVRISGEVKSQQGDEENGK